MKRFILLFTSFLCVIQGYSQSQFDINIGIVVPKQYGQIRSDAFQVLQTKLKSIASRNGVSSDMFGSFVMYPIVNVTNNCMVEGGLKNMFITDVELSLFVKQIDNNAEYGNCSVSLKGAGNSMPEAIKNAFTKINVDDKVYTSFLTDCKRNIFDFYTTNKLSIINKAKTLSNLQKYEEALVLLMTYPESVDGYDEVQQVALQIYKKYQDAICNQMMAEAKSAIAIQDYTTALEILAGIDSESICYKDASRLINSIDMKIQEEQKREYEFKNKLLDNEFELKKKRMEAIRDIAVEFARHHQPQITYTQIIK